MPIPQVGKPTKRVSPPNNISVVLYQPPRRSAVAPPVQAGAPDPCVVPGRTPLAESSLHPWAPQCGSRHPVEAGADAQGMDASHLGGEADLESVWPGSGGPFCISGDITMSPLVLSDSSGSTGAGCYGTDLAEASYLHLSPDCRVLKIFCQDEVQLMLVALFWPGRVWFSDLISLLEGSLGDSRQEGAPLTGRGHPFPELWKYSIFQLFLDVLCM